MAFIPVEDYHHLRYEEHDRMGVVQVSLVRKGALPPGPSLVAQAM